VRAAESGRTVASRILTVFEAFEEHGPNLSLSQIAEYAELPLSTAHRIVGELHQWGALVRDPQGRYQIGLRLWELGQNAGRRLRDTARPFLQDLFSLTGETAHLAVREGNEALYVDRVYGSKRVPRASRIGGRLPLHATAVGKVLLATEAPWFRDAYLHGPLKQLTPYTHVDPVALAAELAEIAENGYAVTGEEARAGACSIAVPVGPAPGSASGQVEAAIGIVALSSQLPTIARHLPVLQGVAHRIAAAIQRRPLPGPQAD
jgi:DNA-binding IclR family transcriptional regulator